MDRRITINGTLYEAMFEVKHATVADGEMYFEFSLPRELTLKQATDTGLLRKLSDPGISAATTTPKTTFSFRMEDADETITEQDLDRMIGRVMPVLFFGRNVPAKVTNAHRYSDPMLGPGIWIEAEYVGS